MAAPKSSGSTRKRGGTMSPRSETKFSRRYLSRSAAYLLSKYQHSIWDKLRLTVKIKVPQMDPLEKLSRPPSALKEIALPSAGKTSLASDRDYRLEWVEKVIRKEKQLVERLRKQVLGRNVLIDEFNKDLNNAVIAAMMSTENVSRRVSMEMLGEVNFGKGCEAFQDLHMPVSGSLHCTEWVEPQRWSEVWRRRTVCDRCNRSTQPVPVRRTLNEAVSKYRDNSDPFELCSCLVEILRNSNDVQKISGGRSSMMSQQCGPEHSCRETVGCTLCDCIAHTTCLDGDAKAQLSRGGEWTCESCEAEQTIARQQYTQYRNAIVRAKKLYGQQIKVAKHWRAHLQINRFRTKKAAVLLLQRMYRRRILTRAVNEERRYTLRPMQIHLCKVFDLEGYERTGKVASFWVIIMVEKRNGGVLRQLTSTTKFLTARPIFQERLLVPAVNGNCTITFRLFCRDEKRERPIGHAVLDLSSGSVWRYGGQFVLPLRSALKPNGKSKKIRAMERKVEDPMARPSLLDAVQSGKGGDDLHELDARLHNALAALPRSAAHAKEEARSECAGGSGPVSCPGGDSRPVSQKGSRPASRAAEKGGITPQEERPYPHVGKISFDILIPKGLRCATGQLSGPDLLRLNDAHTANHCTKTLWGTLIDGHLMLFPSVQEAEARKIIDVRTTALRYEVNREDAVQMVFSPPGSSEVRLKVTDYLEAGSIDRWVTALEWTRGISQGLPAGEIIKRLKTVQSQQVIQRATLRHSGQQQRRGRPQPT